jgi:hypothetical protein
MIYIYLFLVAFALSIAFYYYLQSNYSRQSFEQKYPISQKAQKIYANEIKPILDTEVFEKHKQPHKDNYASLDNDLRYMIKREILKQDDLTEQEKNDLLNFLLAYYGVG